MKKDGSRNDVLCERLLFRLWLRLEAANVLRFYQRILKTQNWPSFIVI
jgi:hypothetical protein